MISQDSDTEKYIEDAEKYRKFVEICGNQNDRNQNQYRQQNHQV